MQARRIILTDKSFNLKKYHIPGDVAEISATVIMNLKDAERVDPI